jgi:hypothetical protein
MSFENHVVLTGGPSSVSIVLCKIMTFLWDACRDERRRNLRH